MPPTAAVNPADNIGYVFTEAQALYISLGFRKLDEMDGDDLVFGL